ncbi:MAG: hypothetical protein CVU41_15630 [Chloroflexi bacterium HGW-Chloroflexi-3]|nr:MAG: hypothetical protein CVU41_15630 [Chloroflexi bacterium HGW-Chloroflexi-3]
MKTFLRSILFTFLLFQFVDLNQQPIKIHAQPLLDATFHLLSDGIFFQDWSDPGLITTQDDWSGVTSIIGFRGDGLTNSDGSDPQTILQDDIPGVVDVNANLLNPNIFTTGGVAEFESIYQTIALSGSGTADAPYIKITLDTTICSDIRVKYTVKDLDGSSDNAIQPVAMQYRTGGAGNFINVPGAFIPDATTGPGLANKVTTVDVILPDKTNNQSKLEIRIMTANAVGNDEWVGIDDIEVSGNCHNPYANPITPTCPSDLFTYEGIPIPTTISATDLDGKVVQTTFQSSPVMGITLEEIQPAVEIGGVLSGTLFIAENAPGGIYNIELLFSNDDPSPQTAICTIPVTVVPKVCSTPDSHQIGEIQGTGSTSPFYGHSNITLSGIVTANFSVGGLNGFYLQDANGDENELTSDGIFVRYNDPALLVGQPVQVTGKVDEYYARTQLSEISLLTFCGVPQELAATPLSLPINQRSDLEKNEGMLVTFPQVLIISEHYNFDRYGELTLTSNHHLSPTSQYEPGSPEYFQSVANFLLDRIILDDGRTIQNPDPTIHPAGTIFDLDNLFRGGDLLRNVTGILDFSMNEYRIQPVQGAGHIQSNLRLEQPDDVGGDIKVVSFNVMNYFTTLGSRGADSIEEFNRQRDKIFAALSVINADVVGLIEIENNSLAIQDLVSGLNTALGEDVYSYVDTGVIGIDEIKVAIIYKPATVSLVGNYALLDSSVDSRFLDTKNRPSLAQSFQDPENGVVFTVVINHFKSRSSSCDDIGDPDVGDGAGNCNLTRKAAAEALVDWLSADPTNSGNKLNLIIGDLNAYSKEDPIVSILAGADDFQSTNDDYTNLITTFVGESAHTYVFDGQSGYLDHAFASTSLAPMITGTTIWHINADEPDLINYDMTYKQPSQDLLYAPDAYRSSDHDPVIIGLDLTLLPPPYTIIYIPLIFQ